MTLTTALTYIDPSTITSLTAPNVIKSGRHSDPSSNVSRLTLNVWTTLADGGCLKVLPKLLSMRRKGGFAVDTDPLDRPGAYRVKAFVNIQADRAQMQISVI